MPNVDPNDVAIEELIDFLRSYELGTVASLPELEKKIFAVYKPFHPLLIWRNHIQTHKPRYFRDTLKYEIFRTYLSEVVSDLSQSVLLFSQGLYKPANLLLRSAVENFVKCIGLFEGEPVLTIKSVFDLFDAVKILPIVTKSKESQHQFAVLRDTYKILCSYVHSKSISFMSLTTALGALPTYSAQNATEYVRLSKLVFSSCVVFLTFMFRNELHRMHHDDMDLILDRIPKRIKQSIFA